MFRPSRQSDIWALGAQNEVKKVNCQSARNENRIGRICASRSSKLFCGRAPDAKRSVVVFPKCREALRHYPALRDDALVDEPSVMPCPVGAGSEQYGRIAALN